MNRVTLIGNLTRDGELRTTINGTEVFRFYLAVKRDFKSEDGDYDTDFIDCVAFNKNAENLAKYTQKGCKLGIDGRIQTGSYEAKDGTIRYTTDVYVDRFDLLTPKKEENEEKTEQHVAVEQVVNDKDPFTEFADEMPLTEDDLPF